MFFDPYGNWSDQWLVISGGSSIQVTEVTVQRELGGAPMTLEQSKTTIPGFLYDSADVGEFQPCLILSVNRLVSPNWGPSRSEERRVGKEGSEPCRDDSNKRERELDI